MKPSTRDRRPSPARFPAGGDDITLDAPAATGASVAQTVELVEVLEQYLDDLRLGKAPPREQLLAQHPAIAEQLEACLAGLDFMHGAERASPATPAQLGDFRIVREIGRGGFGAVYEAEQVSLHRRVALKILRFGAVSDREAIDRFQREAETVAGLHHTNIVPIFSVGRENGVNYYAMQYIEGGSLADMLGPTMKRPETQRIAQWGLQAAEALAHAHERGVIHRDVKPSNLLLDHDNRIWLTDFGLAKRLDDVTLSMTGVLLGTPRYMSPEQASATAQPIDHRTDIYSLGATLYELATGHPVFTGDSPHNVISQILTVEPTPPRHHRPTLPRDFETILLKCLSKDPRERYGSATELADDLRAFLDERPIRARRISVWEQTARWWRRQRRSVIHTGYAVAATLLLIAATVIGRYAHQVWQTSYLRLGTDTPPLVAEILRPETQQVVARHALPTPDPIPLPQGRYALRVTGQQRLSTTYDFDLLRGNEHDFALNLEDQLLFPEVQIPQTFDTVRRGKQSELLVYAEDYLGIVDGRSGMSHANVSMDPRQQPGLDGVKDFIWLFAEDTFGVGRLPVHPFALEPAPDVDQDGEADLLLAGRRQAWLMAISGKSRRVLWVRGLSPGLLSPSADGQKPGDSAVLAPPIAIGDITADGVEDFAVSLVEVSVEPAPLTADRYLQAVSGADGSILWKVPLEEAWFSLPAGSMPPAPFRFARRSMAGMSQMGMASGSSGTMVRRRPPTVELTGYNVWVQDAPWHIGDAAAIGMVAGRKLLVVDQKTGAVRELQDLPMSVEVPVRWANVAGDASPELILLENKTPGVVSKTVTAQMGVYSLRDRKLLWSRDLEVFWPMMRNWHLPRPSWPWAEDVDGDGLSEVLVPTNSSEANNSQAAPWGELELLAGHDGHRLWRRSLRTIDQQIDFASLGPDIDQDGHRDVFTATIWGMKSEIYVDALSGKDGRSLWFAHQRLSEQRDADYHDYIVSHVAWWSGGSDGWPQLLVMAGNPQQPNVSDFLGLLSAGSGQWTRTLRGATRTTTCDLDGDGNEELLVLKGTDPGQPHASKGTLACVQGISRERWRRLDQRLEPAADFDGDGIADLLEKHEQRMVAAISGATGEQIWRTRVPGTWDVTLRPVRTSALVLKHPVRHQGASLEGDADGDLDGDHVADLLAWPENTVGSNQAFPILYALSGKTGRVLWESDWLATMFARMDSLELCDLDGDGQAELVCLGVMNRSSVSRSPVTFVQNERNLWAVVLSARHGTLLWKTELISESDDGSESNVFHMNAGTLRATYADCNADGKLDVLVPAALDGRSAWSLVPLSGVDGKPIWRRALRSPGEGHSKLQSYVPPLVADLDGDGIQELVILEFEETRKENGQIQNRAHVSCLRAHDVDLRWTWSGEVPAECGRFASALPLELALRPAPQLLRRANRPAQIVLNFWANFHPGQVVVLDHTGKLVSQRTVKTDPVSFQAWPFDAQGDGTDELLIVSDQQVSAYAPENFEQPLWSWPLESTQGMVWGLFPRKGQAPLALIGGGPFDTRMDALDTAHGERVWNYRGPIPRDQEARILPEQMALLAPGTGSQKPMVFLKYQDVGLVRDGTWEPTHAAEPQLPTREVSSAAADPRMVRSLPWRVDLETRKPGRIASYAAWAIFHCCSLVIVPGFYVRYLIRTRNWNLRTFLVLPAIMSLVALALITNGPDSDFQSVRSKIGIALLLSPAFLYLYRLSGLFVRQRWRTAGAWVLTTLIISVACGGFALWFSHSQSQGPLAPGERYSLEGWYWIVVLSAYYTGFFMFAVIVLRAIGRASRWVWQRRFRSSPPTPTAGAV